MNAYPVFSPFLLNSAAAGLLVLLVLAVQWLFRRQLSPTWRCALWLVVVARLLIPISIGSPVSLMRWLPRPAKPVAYSAVPAQSVPAFQWAEITPANPVPVAPLTVTRAETEIVTPTRSRNVAAPVPVGAVLFWGWIAGIGVLAANVAWSALRLQRRLRACTAVSDSATRELLASCAATMGVRRVPPVAECPGLASPALHGFLRPRLLLPAGFTAEFSANEQRLVFLHEMAHLRRHDLPLNWLVTALQVVNWFNPLLWLGFARWRADREVACDALSLEAAGAGQNQAYGRTILHLLERNRPQFAGSGLVGILEDCSQLRHRLRMIAGFAPVRRRPLLVPALLAALAAVGLTDAQTSAPAVKGTEPAVTTAPLPSVMPFAPSGSVPTPPPPAAAAGTADNGGRRVLSAGEVPPAYTVIDRAKMDALNITDPNQAAGWAPGQSFNVGRAIHGTDAREAGFTQLALVVDTSGSMRNPDRAYHLYEVIGNLVERELKAHPGVREFALLNSDGGAMLGTNDNPWLPNDDASRRKATLTLKDYDTLSQSNPVPGIAKALMQMTAPTDGNGRLSICVIGDEATIGPAAALQRLAELNPADAQGNRRATISAIQLPTALGNPALADQTTGIAFRDLMTAVARAHGGTYRLLASLEIPVAAPAPQTGTGGNASPGPATARSRNPAGGDTFSVDFPNEEIRSVLRNVAELFDINIIIPETLQGRTSVKLQNVTWQQVFKTVLDPVGYTYFQEGNIIRIEPAQ
jgi:beta-lactamase regulating signal transducer with metallopeptidase domain